MTTLTVELGERSYPISIQANLLKQKGILDSYLTTKKVVVVTNDVIESLYYPQLLTALEGYQVSKIVIPDGEQYKNLATFEKVISELLSMSAGRDTTLIALGGVVV